MVTRNGAEMGWDVPPVITYVSVSYTHLMPSGVPVACVAINGAKNAAIYATQILGACDPEYRKVIEKMKQELSLIHI